jgi:hypothetical protein
MEDVSLVINCFSVVANQHLIAQVAKFAKMKVVRWADVPLKILAQVLVIAEMALVVSMVLVL